MTKVVVVGIGKSKREYKSKTIHREFDSIVDARDYLFRKYYGETVRAKFFNREGKLLALLKKNGWYYYCTKNGK